MCLKGLTCTCMYIQCLGVLCHYISMGMPASSLHRESTNSDTCTHVYVLVLQVEASLFSSKFSISRKTTIPSDNTEHKVHVFVY